MRGGDWVIIAFIFINVAIVLFLLFIMFSSS